MSKHPVAIRKSAPRPLTDSDREKFLELVAGGLSESAAAAMIRPASLSNRPGRSSIESLKARDVQFREAIEDAKQRFSATVMQELVKRAIHGSPEYLSYKGKIGDIVLKKSDTVLLRIAQAIFPSFSSQTIHRHEGQIEHVHSHNQAQIDLSKIYALSAEQQRQLAAILPLLAPDGPDNDQAAIEVEFEAVEAESDPYQVPPEGF